ncbi:MAG: CDP-alcohol phosphatidyltransferase family protein [Thermoplasmata archaeon]|nr:MAG: CDP-alcohol phosphatidyltransferase family protein [Thermoplasmata archaeon]HDN95533.1 CDP-alcohol phosphatidyltransferase family protein [Thermoplasmatales archaeon]
MLDKYRQKADKILEPMAKKIGMEANILTYLSLIFAVMAGIAAFFSFEKKWLLLPASIFILLNGLFDALDGKIARMRGKASKKGDFIDHAIDRFADVFIIGGIVASPWVDKVVGLAAMAAMLLVSYLGTQAQAIGYKRVYFGILGRADRIVILFFACIIQFFVIEKIYGFYFMEWVMFYFIVAGIATILQRYYTVMKWFGKS